MTIEFLKNAIARLIKKRAELHGQPGEQEKINKRLTKLYDLKYIALQQEDK